MPVLVGALFSGGDDFGNVFFSVDGSFFFGAFFFFLDVFFGRRRGFVGGPLAFFCRGFRGDEPCRGFGSFSPHIPTFRFGADRVIR